MSELDVEATRQKGLDAEAHGMEDHVLLLAACEAHAKTPTDMHDVFRDVTLFNEVLRRLATIDKLLAHCPNDECGECSEIVCPHGEFLHLHHDGCPACWHEEEEARKANSVPST